MMGILNLLTIGQNLLFNLQSLSDQILHLISQFDIRKTNIFLIDNILTNIFLIDKILTKNFWKKKLLNNVKNAHQQY